MDRTLKTILWVLGFGLLAAIIYGVVSLYLFFDAVKTKCETIDSIQIKNYKIEKLSCLDWAGPRYTKYRVFENNKRIYGSRYELDSCNVDYVSNDHILYKIDYCNKSIRKEINNKRLIDKKSTDSIYLKNLSTNDSVKLTLSLQNKFVEDWNNASIESYSTNEHIFYKEHEYQFIVYSKNNIRKFNTEHFFIKEEKVNWIYTFLKEGKDRKTNQVFQDFWNETQK